MVGPPTAADRAGDRRRVAAWLVGIVALSAVMTATYGGATALEVVLLGAAGVVAGSVLAVALGTWP